MSWKEIKKLPHDAIFFLSIGPMEAHGPHLPISTDFEIARKVREETIKMMEERGYTCISLPPLPVGSCKSLQGFPGTMSIKWKTLSNLIYDYIKSISQHGFRYFVIINFHMDIVHLKGIYKAMKRLRREGIKIVEPLSPCYFRGELFEDIRGEVHADVKETSLALYLFPHMVGDYRIKDVHVNFNVFNAMKSFLEVGAEDAYIGSPSKGNKDYGEKLFKKMVECCVNSSIMLGEGKIKDLPAKIKILIKI